MVKKMNGKFAASLMMATALTFATPTKAQSIFEALGQTYNTNPTLQARRAYLRSVDENAAIAKSGYRPNIALTGGYNDRNSNVDNGSPLSQAGGDSSTTTLAAKISQPIFNGFATVNSVKAADSLIRAEQNNLSTIEQNIFLEASTAYLDVLQNAAIVDLQKNNEKLLKKRLDETVQRFNVGEVTRTDVSQARARHSQAVSDRIASEGTYEASKATYVQLIGTNPEKLEEPEAIKDFLPKSYEEAHEIAVANNYSILAAKNLLKSQSYDVYTNTGALLPQVSLDGSVSKVKTEYDNNLLGDTTSDNVEWGVNMIIPLYNSGESRAKIRQSKYKKWQAQEQVIEAERQVKSVVSSAWEYMVSNQSKIKAIQEQVNANQVALDGVQKEEALGNRTILDVLDAYQELLNSNVNEVKARRDYYVSGMNLLMSMGKLTAKDLKLGVDIYNPKKFYKETRDKWLSLN